MCKPDKTTKALRKLKREQRNLECAVLNRAMTWYDLRESAHEKEMADRLAAANQNLREKFWQIRRFKAENQL